LLLYVTPVSDLSPPAALMALRPLHLVGRAVSDEAVAEFQSMRRERGLPEVEILGGRD